MWHGWIKIYLFLPSVNSDLDEKNVIKWYLVNLWYVIKYWDLRYHFPPWNDVTPSHEEQLDKKVDLQAFSCHDIFLSSFNKADAMQEKIQNNYVVVFIYKYKTYRSTCTFKLVEFWL